MPTDHLLARAKQLNEAAHRLAHQARNERLASELLVRRAREISASLLIGRIRRTSS